MSSQANATLPQDQPKPSDWKAGDLRIERVNWVTTIFLVLTALIGLIAPWFYIPAYGFGWMEATLFLFMFIAGGLSITAGYHRLFSHRTYQGAWPIKLLAVLFGASTFQMSALAWSSEHRYHHKYTDMDGDPHDPHSIHRGFLWAHVGWLMVRVNPRLQHTNVDDLRRDAIVMWQDKFYVWIASVMGFILPMCVGAGWSALSGSSVVNGVLAGFLFGGCLRVAVLHHCTFFINSLAHIIGRQPYDSTNTARDSGLLAFFTFGEGYHNYHHAFQTDYRNGIKAWHFDPAKWLIWTASKLGLAKNLRRVPLETVKLAQLREKRVRLERRLENKNRQSALESWRPSLDALEERLEELHLEFRRQLVRYTQAKNTKIEQQRELLVEMRADMRDARRRFNECFKDWRRVHRQALAAR